MDADVGSDSFGKRPGQCSGFVCRALAGPKNNQRTRPSFYGSKISHMVIRAALIYVN
jgi:hypothetical protein